MVVHGIAGKGFLMTSRGLSAWFAIGCSLLAILVAVDRPHWFGLQAGAVTATGQRVAGAAKPAHRSTPWVIRHHDDTRR